MGVGDLFSVFSAFMALPQILAVVKESLLTAPVLRFAASQGTLTAKFAWRLPRVVIVGEGGAGKSTLLKQMLAHAAAAGYVPVWMPLSSLPDDGPLTIATLVDHMVEQAQTHLGLAEVNRTFFETLAVDGRLAIGFDALDECGSLPRRQRVRGLLVEVAREWKRCHIFVTSRPDALRDTPLPMIKPAAASAEQGAAGKADGETAKGDEFVGLTPRPFTRDDVAPFLAAAFEDGEQLAQDLLQRTGIEALIETPLTLMLVGLVARPPKRLPDSRTTLFARCLDTVVETWEEAKTSQPLADKLEPDQRREVLQRLGWDAQVAGGAALDAWPARASLARLPYVGGPARAKTVVDGLARRNLLLRAEVADDGGFEVRRIRFAHPQFREYLAGAHLAEQFALDPNAAAAALAAYWFETSWLDVLRFAVTSVELDTPRRDQLLRAALAADDPYRDLLRRPDFLVARLLAALPAHQSTLVAGVVATLEHTALDEPALRVAALEALFAIAHHEPAVPAIERFARGDGIGRVFALDQSSFDDSLRALRWRLRAIESLAVARGAAAALALLPDDPPGFSGVMATCELRARLSDRAGAYAIWERLFALEPMYREAIAASMDKSGERDRFNGWLSAWLNGNQVTVRDVKLARSRELVSDDAEVWARVLTRATKQVAALSADEAFAPAEVSEAVYAAAETKASASSAAGRGLLTAALRHPSLVWYVGPRLGKILPDLAAEAVERLLAYSLEALAAATPLHDSRVNIAVNAIADESDDRLAAPALLTLLGAMRADDHRAPIVIESLQRRGHGGDALAVLRPRLELPPGADDHHQDENAWSRGHGWHLARSADPAGVLSLLDAMYRSGDPETDARRLMHIWFVSGVAGVARDWFHAVAQDATDDRGRRFLFTLTTHERDTGFSDEARHALDGGVFYDDDKDEVRTPWTQADAERAFEFAMAEGWYADEHDQEQKATTDELIGLIWLIARSNEAAAIRHAGAWFQRTLEDVESSPEHKTAALADGLQQLAHNSLHDERWVGPVAAYARALPPSARVELVEWLNAVA